MLEPTIPPPMMTTSAVCMLYEMLSRTAEFEWGCRFFASVLRLNGNGKPFGLNAGSRQRMVHHGIAFCVWPERSAGHGFSAIGGQQPEFIRFVRRQGIEIAGHQQQVPHFG